MSPSYPQDRMVATIVKAQAAAAQPVRPFFSSTQNQLESSMPDSKLEPQGFLSEEFDKGQIAIQGHCDQSPLSSGITRGPTVSNMLPRIPGQLNCKLRTSVQAAMNTNKPAAMFDNNGKSMPFQSPSLKHYRDRQTGIVCPVNAIDSSRCYSDDIGI